MKKAVFALTLVFGLSAGRAPFLAAQTEMPGKQIPEAPPTIEVVAQFIEGYALQQASGQDGWMKIIDPETDQTLKLHLEKVHREGLSKTADRTYSVCADFKSPEGKRYDIDFWIKEDGGKLVVSDTAIHKVDGVPRYIWMEMEGVWAQVPV